MQSGRRGFMACLGVALILATWGLVTCQKPAEPELEMAPLTALEGVESWPALSPDGARLAYTWDGGDDGPYQLFVKLVDVGDSLQLTHGKESVVAPTWSPDGDRIAFLRGSSGEYEIVEMASLGGVERVLGYSIASRPGMPGLSWSPDGVHLAVVDKPSVEHPNAIYLLSGDTGQKRQITHPPRRADPLVGDQSPEMAPDGELLAFVRRRHLASSDLFLVSTTTGEETRLTFDQAPITSVAWSPNGESLVFASERGGLRALWFIPRAGGEPERLAAGERAWHVTISRRGSRLAYSRWLTKVDIWRVAGPAAEERSHATQLIGSSSSDIDPQYSPDGKRIVFSTSRTGRREIWTCNHQGLECRRLVDGMNPSWSPDGKLIAYAAAFDEGQADLFVIDARGGPPHRLTHGGVHWLPSWSRDGKWIYFLQGGGKRTEIWKLPLAGGESIQVTRDEGVNAIESSDRSLLYFSTEIELRQRRSQIWRMPVEGGAGTLMVDRGPDFMNWDLWQDQIVFIDPDGPAGPSLQMLDPERRKSKELAVLGEPAAASRGLSVSPDGRWVLYSQRDLYDSDLILVDNLSFD